MKRGLLSQSKNEVKWRRSYKACYNCRSRKVKCDMGPLDSPHEPPCERCKREGKVCELPKSKRRHIAVVGRGNSESDLSDEVEVQRKLIANAMINSQDFSSRSRDDKSNGTGGKWKFEISSMQNALEFLAKAAGSVAREEDSLSGDGDRKINQINPSNIDKGMKIQWKGTTPNSSDASEKSITSPVVRKDGPSKTSIPLIEKLGSVRPQSSVRLTDIEYIGDSNLISEHEAIKLIEVFFLTMHPFFPHIPLQLQDPKELARYPLLLCSILTISARYHSFEEMGLRDDDNRNRNIAVHENLWIYCQRLISQTIWAEASTRSFGTVLAFLLFTEWNPRAIHWRWSDYANSSGVNDILRKDSYDVSTVKDNEGLTGMAAIRRSDRMAWMLTGNAVRLAQDMGFIETSGKIFIATHISETHTAMNVNQRSTLAESLGEINLGSSKGRQNLEVSDDKMSNEQFYLERILENDDSKGRWTKFLHDNLDNSSPNHEAPLTDVEREFLNDEYVLYYASNDDARQRNLPTSLPFPLSFSRSQRAKIELLRITSIGYEAIYCNKDKQQLLLNDPKRNLALLNIISPLIESWNETYHDLMEPAEGPPCTLDISQNKSAVNDIAKKIDGESLICDYYYCQLYVYSLALQVDVKESRLKLSEITRSAKYVELAYSAAKEILTSASRLHNLKMLKRMPVRWITRIVRSVAYIVKCYLTLTANGVVNDPLANTILKLTIIPAEETLQTIQKAAIILKEASPDELHLCMRYSTILMYLCSEMKRRNPVSNGTEIDHQSTDENSCQDDDMIYKRNAPIKQYNDRGSRNLGQRDDTRQQKMQENASGQPQSQPHLHAQSQTSSQVEPALPNGSNVMLCGPSLPDEVVDWFSTSDEIGLEFVESWTEMIEQRYLQSGDIKGQSMEGLYNQASGNISDDPHN